MRFLSPATAILVLICAPAGAQKRLDIDRVEICSYYGEQIVDDLYSFDSDAQAESFVGDIMQYTGLPQNFKIEAANVPNAAAVIRQGEEAQDRLILYSQEFIRGVIRQTGTSWSATSIMAHEIGHHLSGHTLPREGGSRPDTELEADKFSGHILFKMGASLEEAKAALSHIEDTRGSKTHPPKSARLAAVHNGWLLARDQAEKLSPSPPPPPPPETRTALKLPPPSLPPPPPPQTPSASVFVGQMAFNVPVFHPGLGTTWPGFTVPMTGSVLNAQGRTLRVEVRFTFAYGPPLFAHPHETIFRNAAGHVATGTAAVPVASSHVDLARLDVLPVPYFVLNLVQTGGAQRYELHATAYVFLDEVQVSQSAPTPFWVVW